jgi:cytochrome c oxidase assembly protein subunit 11
MTGGTTRRRNRTTLWGLLGILAVMFGLTAYSETLYRIFCETTGYGGATRVATGPSDRVLDRTIKVRFNADIASDLPWTFRPSQRDITVRIGERALAFYTATNNSDRPVTGQATYNVMPEKTGQYFNKIQCFCFEEQTLAPHQTVEMPVSFFVDPAIAANRNANDISEIVLSYTFFRAANDGKNDRRVSRLAPETTKN